MNNALRLAKAQMNKLKADKERMDGTVKVDIVLNFDRNNGEPHKEYRIPIFCTRSQAIKLQRTAEYKDRTNVLSD